MKTMNRRAIAAISFFILLFQSPALVHAQITPPPPADRLLDSWAFSDSTWESDFGYAPLAFTNITFVTNTNTDGRGGWLLLDTTNDVPAYLIYNTVENDGTTNLLLPAGTFSLFFSPNWSSTNAGGTGPGAWGRLFEAGTYTTNASIGWLSLYLSPDGSTVYFSGQTNNGNGSNYLSAPVSLTNNAWYNLVLTYGPTNSALYLNGLPLTNGSGVAWYPSPDVLTNGFSFGSSAADGLSQARGMFGNLFSYSYPLDSNVVYLDYITYSAFSYGGGGSSFANVLTNAPSTPSSLPAVDLISGPGILHFVTNTSSCVTSSSVWITNLTATQSSNQIVNVTFTIAGGSNNLAYDVFGTTTLASPMVNSQWAWLGQGYHCSTYTFSSQSNSAVFLILGTPQSTSGDGLTDAYQLFVSKTNPDTTSTDGLPNGWIALNGLTGSANLANLDPDSDGLSNMQEYLYGTKPLVSEGFAVWVNTSGLMNGIP
jgi:hypothetical protein